MRGAAKGEEIFLPLIRKQKCGEFKKLIPGRWQKLGARAARGLRERQAPQNDLPHPHPPAMSSWSQQILTEDLPHARYLSRLRKPSSGQNRQIPGPKEMHTYVLFSGK